MENENSATYNLTGGDIQTILDNLLYRALEPIVQHTCVFDTQIVHILSRVSINKKRKLVSIDRLLAISMLAKALVETNVKIKFKLIESAKIERCIIHRFITILLTDLKQFDSLYKRNFIKSDAKLLKKMNVIASSLGATDIESLYCAYAQASEFVEAYFNYRNSVVDHYIKFAYKVSNSFRTTKHNNYDSGDVQQNFLSAITKAIDKYDSSKGALTSYINYWILNAQTCNSNSSEYGIAYTLPHGKKRSRVSDKSNVNFSLSLDSKEMLNAVHADNVYANFEIDEEHKIIQYLTKAVDKNGCVRLTLDIGEYHTKKEYAAMRRQMTEESISEQ